MREDVPRAGLAKFIAHHIDSILQECETFARSLTPLADVDPAALRDRAEAILRALVDPGAHAHPSARHADGFTLDQLVAEFRAIRASVLAQWAADASAMSDNNLEEMVRFNDALDQALAVSIARHGALVEESRAKVLAALAHDLRNPLNTVAVGLHRIVRSESTDSASSQTAARALKSVDRIAGLIADRLESRMPRHPDRLRKE